MRIARCFCLLVVAVLVGSPSVYGQSSGNSASDLSYWGYGGPNVTTLGVGVHGGLAVAFDGHVLSARATSTDIVYGNETWDIALLYGRAIDTDNFFLSAATGVSVVGGKSYSRLLSPGRDAGNELAPMLGFPLQAQVSWTPTGVGAVGLYGFANVNTGQPFGGAGVVVRIGDL